MANVVLKYVLWPSEVVTIKPPLIALILFAG